MRRHLSKLAYLLAATLLVIFLFWLSALPVRGAAVARHTRQTILDLQAQLVQLTAPDRIQPGSLDSVARYRAEQLEKLQSATAAINLKPPLGLAIINALPADDTEADKSVRSAQLSLMNLRSEVSQQARIAAALQKVLEYNPAIDLQGFDPGSDDGRQRLTRADQGLAAARRRLNDNQPIDDENEQLRAIDRQLASLQTELSTLKRAGDAKRWIAAVTQAQADIIKAHTADWRQAVTEVSAHSSRANAELAALEQDLNTLRQGFRFFR